MTRRVAGAVVAATLLAAGGAHATGPAMDAQLRSLDRDDLKVTEGQVEGHGRGLRVQCAKMRAVAPRANAQVAELRFTYLGPSEQQLPLESGEMRRQIGLKLRARDGCNLVYVMWRLEPVPALMVSTKVNPGMTESKQCRNGGYRNIKARRALKLGAPGLDVPHVLRAELEPRAHELKVLVDGKLAWEGDLGPEAFTFDGPVGVRSDNGRFDFELLAAH